MKLQANKFILLLATSLLIWLTSSLQIVKGQQYPSLKRQDLSSLRGDFWDLENRDNFCFVTVPELTDKLLQDLPNYANRVIQRTQNNHREVRIDTYIIEAGKAEFEPLPLPQLEYASTSTEGVYQIFFTILERQYTQNRKIERETYHWLFVIPTTQGWKMIMLFSRFGDRIKNAPSTPPQETSKGIIGQAINLWLKDCSVGVIR